jgi:hypothetical protein
VQTVASFGVGGGVCPTRGVALGRARVTKELIFKYGCIYIYIYILRKAAFLELRSPASTNGLIAKSVMLLRTGIVNSE